MFGRCGLSRGAGDLVAEILRSPEARRMREMVTRGFYDRSRIGLWLFEVIGREYDEMSDWSRNLRLEAFPQTCTWSIDIWEFVCGIVPDDSLPLTYRRERIMSKWLQRPPVSPARIEAVLSGLISAPVVVTENTAPYSFEVDVDVTDAVSTDMRPAVRTLRRIKPSHLSFEFRSTAVSPMSAEVSAFAASVSIMTTRIPMLEVSVFDAGVAVGAGGGVNVMTTRLTTGDEQE